ncbi:Conserved_hypothetical protein [Hexamita inflata]|uniref:Uncharacterized protein n=1 Tax=Hexamita inflata TaxID=28002 RepID=A0ABP1HWJ7_9EUKA
MFQVAQEKVINNILIINKSPIFKYFKGMFSYKYLILRVVFGSILICSCFVISGLFSVQFDIRRDTFSTLGSWTSTNNPKCWYMFSIGLIISFIVVLPLISYQHQRIVYVNKILSFTVAICLLCGCISFIVIAFFPIVYQPIVPNGIVQFATIHKIFASSGCVLLLIGYFVLFSMLIIDQCKKKQIFGLAFKIALSLLITFFIIAVIVNITWCVMYPMKYKRDNSIGKSNEASAFTIFSFALWENLEYIQYLFSFQYHRLCSQQELTENIHFKAQVKSQFRIQIKFNCTRNFLRSGINSQQRGK